MTRCKVLLLLSHDMPNAMPKLNLIIIPEFGITSLFFGQANFVIPILLKASLPIPSTENGERSRSSLAYDQRRLQACRCADESELQ